MTQGPAIAPHSTQGPAGGRHWIEDALHDLCQPLTALQCRLFLGSLSSDADEGAASIRESLQQCDRVMEHVRAMQLRLQTGGAQ